jgi:hypothetical protein
MQPFSSSILLIFYLRIFLDNFAVMQKNYMQSLSLTLTLLLSVLTVARGQKQLVVLSNQKVIMRFNPGDQMIISVKGEKDKIDSYVNNLFDTAVMLHKTIIPLHKIDKIYFKQSGLLNLVGKFLVVGGVAYFVIDQFNIVVVNGDEANLDEDVTTVSAAMVAAGLPMMLIKKKSQRIRGRTRLMTVQKGSPFYLSPITSGASEP